MNEIDLIKKIKINIKQLVERGNYDNAKILINEYKKIVQNDIELFSIEAVVLIAENQYEFAEQVIKEGLKIDNKNYDLLYNLAYLYEFQHRYFESLVNYRIALRFHYFEIDRMDIIKKIDNMKQLIFTQNSNSIELSVSKIDSILLIDFDNKQAINDFAIEIANLGINVDIAFIGTDPVSNVTRDLNPYRKILSISTLQELVEYSHYYNYDVIHLCNDPQKIEADLKKENFKNFVFKAVENVDLKEYFSSLQNLNTKNRAQDNKKEFHDCDLCILLPTYNRPSILKRVICNLANFTKIKPRILVLDSSSPDKKLSNMAICKEYSSLINIEYVEYDCTVLCDKKIYDGLLRTNNEIVLICPDDDFYAEEGIIESYEILIKRKDIFSVKGRTFYFDSTLGNLKEYDMFYTLDDDSDKERLKMFTSGHVSTLSFQMFRREKYIKLIDFYQKLPIYENTNETFHEYLFYFLVVLTGKVYKVNRDLAIRNKGIIREYSVRNFDDAIKDYSFNSNYEFSADCLLKYSELNSGDIKPLDVELVFSQFLNVFLGIPNNYINFINGKFDVELLKDGMKKSWVWRD